MQEYLTFYQKMDKKYYYEEIVRLDLKGKTINNIIQSYINLVNEFIEWNKSGHILSNAKHVNVQESLSRSRKFLESL